MSQARRMLNPLYSAEYRDKVLSYGPIAYWMLGEKSGTVAYDEITDVGHVDTGQSGDHSVSSLGNAGIGDGNSSPEYDGTNDYTDVYTVTLNNSFDGQRGSLAVCARVINSGVWTDGTDRVIVGIYVGANNLLRIYRSSTNNRIIYRYRAGGTTETVTLDGLSTTDWMYLGMSWDLNAGANGEMRAYYAGLQTGTIQTALGTWAGNLSNIACAIGAVQIAPIGQPWNGYIAHPSIFDTALSSSAFSVLSVV